MRVLAGLVFLLFCMTWQVILLTPETPAEERMLSLSVPPAAIPPVVVQLTHGLLTIEVEGASLRKVLEAVARQSGVRIYMSTAADEPITLKFHNLPFAEGLGRILHGHSFALFYAGAAKRGGRTSEASLIEVHLLTSSGNRGADTQTPDPAPGAGIVEGLGKLRDGQAIGPLSQALALEEDPTVREEAVKALGKLWHEGAVAPLAEALLGDTDTDVRGTAAQALGETWSEEAVAPLVQAMLEDPNSSVREQAARALGRIGDPSTEPYLTLALRDDDVTVRQRAVWALEAIGSPQVAVSAQSKTQP